MSNGWTLCAFADDQAAAERLARAMALPCQLVESHRFPDGEIRLRLDPVPERALAYRSLHHPNDKLIELLLLASVLRNPAGPPSILIVPYLPYMRQDTAFRPGEAISQRVVGHLLGNAFDTIVTVDPHLHRTRSLDTVFAGAQALATSAAPLLAALIEGMDRPLILVGPDRESEPLVGAVATRTGLPFLILDKRRRGDTAVTFAAGQLDQVKGRGIVLIDDIVSTGGTLIEAARILRESGCARIEALIVHALFDDVAAARIAAAGIERIRSTDSVPHATNAAHLAPLLAAAVRRAAAL
jgi:ribose-phosphate pyrophosphokinase